VPPRTGVSASTATAARGATGGRGRGAVGLGHSHAPLFPQLLLERPYRQSVHDGHYEQRKVKGYDGRRYHKRGRLWTTTLFYK